MFEITVRPNGPAKYKMFTAQCRTVIDGECYTARNTSDGCIRVTASTPEGWDARYPMMTKTNKPVWDALVAAVKREMQA